MDAKARAVTELIEHGHRWPVHLIGNSLGGAVCVRVAARRPDLIRTLTLISPALPDLRPRLLPLRVAAFCAPGVGRRAMRRLDRLPAEARTLGTVREVYLNPGLMHPSRYAEEAAEVRRRDGLGYTDEVLIGSARGLVAEYLRPGPRSLWRDAARVTVPTLVLYGSHDRLVSPRDGRPGRPGLRRPARARAAEDGSRRDDGTAGPGGRRDARAAGQRGRPPGKSQPGRF